MNNQAERTAEHWDEFTDTSAGKKTGLYWVEVPEVLRSINRSISGDPHVDWTEYTVRKYFSNRLPLTRCLSLGSGTGELERNLARTGAFVECDAYDISPKAVERARELAKKDGLNNIQYAVRDINQLSLPRDTYDAVWLYGALHHFHSLETVSREIAQSLTPGGLLLLNEYVGPARFQFPQRQKEIANLCLRLLPRRYRLICAEALKEEQKIEVRQGRRANWRLMMERLGLRKAGELNPSRETGAVKESERYRESVGFPSADQVASLDPSEAVRSHEIFEVLERHFEVIEKVEWGGNIVQFLLAGIACNFSDDDPASVELVKLVFEIERVLLQCGEIKSDFAYLVARPQRVEMNKLHQNSRDDVG